MTAQATGPVRWQRAGAVVEVTLDGPPANEIGEAMLAGLEALVADLRRPAHADVRALVLTSAIPQVFSAGADLRGLSAAVEGRATLSEGVDDALLAEVASFLDRVHATFDALDQLPLTTVAAVEGLCFGGGLELALTCDLIIADKGARFAFPELRLGLIPGFGGVPRLRRDVGNQVIRDLLMTGRSLGAARAHEVGLTSQLTGRGHAVRAARHVAAQAARTDGATLAAAKRFIKPLPAAELQREKAVFLDLFARPVVRQALLNFTQRDDAQPYLPAPRATAS